jgi:tetratricopeptide (TPR) repeat protein
MADLKRSSLNAMVRQLRQWAREQALPLLASGAANVDPKFQGVSGMGKLLLSANYTRPLDVEKLTYRNAFFWRGVMEMVPGNHQIAAMPVFLYMANGELDKAYSLLQMCVPFSNPQSLAGVLENQARERLAVFDRELRDRILKGIALHDKGSFNAAMATYREILAEYPCSAWARYELFYSTLQQGGAKAMAEEIKSGKLWDEASREIFRFDPLYDTQFSGQAGKTKGAQLARFRLRLIKNKKNVTIGEYIGCFADSALKLENHGYAALTYWFSLSAQIELIEPNEREAKQIALTKDDDVRRYCYCVRKLGCKEILTGIQANTEDSFQKLDAQLKAFRNL